MTGFQFGQRIKAWHLLTSLQNMKDNLHTWKVVDKDYPEVLEVAMQLAIDHELAEGEWMVEA